MTHPKKQIHGMGASPEKVGAYISIYFLQTHNKTFSGMELARPGRLRAPAEENRAGENVGRAPRKAADRTR